MTKQPLIVAFDAKDGELVDCAFLARIGLPLFVLSFTDLAIAALQPPQNMAIGAFINVMTQLFAVHLDLFASRRLMGDTLDLLFKRRRAPGTWPWFSEWMATIEKIHANAVSRLGQYREAALWAMKGVYRELGGVIDYTSSNMLEQIFSMQGCVVIHTGGLSVEARSLLASLFINYAFESRKGEDPDELRPLVFMLDDALPLLRGSAAADAEGGINPISTWSFMGRSRKIGICAAVQNFSLLSPAFSNNASTVLCFGSYGRDAEELARYMNLTRDQAAMLPVAQRGGVVAIARSVWPMAVRGRVAEVV